MPDLEKRLQDRYEKLVKGHTATLQDVAAGIRSLPDADDERAEGLRRLEGGIVVVLEVDNRSAISRD